MPAAVIVTLSKWHLGSLLCMLRQTTVLDHFGVHFLNPCPLFIFTSKSFDNFTLPKRFSFYRIRLSGWLSPHRRNKDGSCTSCWAMARGHRLNTSIVLAAVHGLSGLFRAVSAVEPSLFHPLSHSVPIPNKPSRFHGRKATKKKKDVLGFCALLTELILKGLTSKNCLWCLCVFYVCVGTVFRGLTKEMVHYIYMRSFEMWICLREFDWILGWLCSWWDVKIQLLPNF